MNYPKALSQNLIARYDAMREIREANDRIKELASQWEDLNKEAQTNNWMAWFDFHNDEINLKHETLIKTTDVWEKANVGWQVTSNGVRAIRKKS